jgi:hypothetical protein
MKNKKQIIAKLVKIADQLDNNNQTLEADQLDGVITEIKSDADEVEIPEDELLSLEGVFKALSDSLGKTSAS